MMLMGYGQAPERDGQSARLAMAIRRVLLLLPNLDAFDNLSFHLNGKQVVLLG
jgi:hypothetical protein